MPDLTIPADLLPADGRFGAGPSKVRVQALEALAATGIVVPRHVPPAGHGPRRRRPGARRARLAVLAARRLRGRPRQRWRHGLLGRRDVRADPRAQPAPVVRGVLGEVRGRVEGGAVPRRADRDHGRPGHAADVQGRGGRRRLRLAAQRDLDRRDGSRRPGRGGRRRRARDDRRDVGRRRTPRRRQRDRRLLLRAAEVLRRRRWPLDRADVAGRARTGRGDHGERALDPGVPRPQDRDRQLAPQPDLQHPLAGDPLPARRADRLDQRPRRALRRGRAYDGVVRHAVRLGREVGVRHALRRRRRPTGPW